MRYNTTEITEHYAWALVSITVISELGSKKLVEVGDGYIGEFVEVIGENRDGVKLGRTKQSISKDHPEAHNYYILIPETHPMYNSNILIHTYRNDQSRSATIYDATDFIRNELKDLFVSLKQELGVD